MPDEVSCLQGAHKQSYIKKLEDSSETEPVHSDFIDLSMSDSIMVAGSKALFRTQAFT